MTDYASLVEYIVKNIVDNPDDVVIEAHPGRGRSHTIEISLAPEDVGRVIGKSGRNIEAIRAVVKAASIKDRERVNVEVLADDLPASPAEGETPVEGADDTREADPAGEADATDATDEANSSEVTVGEQAE
jgi:predicted RNA-binding protein YlqC (UPF0109 family)